MWQPLGCIRGGPKKTWNLVLTCSSFSPLQSPLHLMQYIYRDVFSTAQKFLNSSILMPFSASAIFLFRLFHIGKMRTFSSRETKKSWFFPSGEANKIKVAWGEIGWIGRVGHRGHDLQNTQCVLGSCPCKSPGMKRANALTILEKNSLKPNTASNSVSWYTDNRWVPRTLTQWGKPALQRAHPAEIISGGFGVPSHTVLELCTFPLVLPQEREDVFEHTHIRIQVGKTGTVFFPPSRYWRLRAVGFWRWHPTIIRPRN